MEQTDPYAYFLAAVEKFERSHNPDKDGPFRKWLALELKIKASRVTQMLGKKAKGAEKPGHPAQPASVTLQTSVANLFHFDFVDFLDLGRRILVGDEVTGPGDLAAATAKVKKNGLDVRILGDVNGAGEPPPCRNPEEDYLGVPLYEEGRLSAGNGGMALDPWEKPASHVVIYRPELRGRAAHTLAAFRVGGDSMLPTITPGSIVVADLSDRAFADNRLFLINDPTQDLPVAAVKRIRQFKNGYLLVSDNPDHPPEPTALDWDRLAIGRVIWTWKSVEQG